MPFKSFTYLLLLLFFLPVPVFMGLRQKIRFLPRLKYMLPAVIFSTLIFGLWDIRFTEHGIWSFNPDFLTGIEIGKIPLEEWLSFVVIPLSALYIYEWLKARFENFEKANVFVALSLVIFIASAILAYSFRTKLFSFFTFFLTAVYLGYTVFRNRFKPHYTKFYMSFFISLVPFGIISMFQNSLPVVIYENSHVIGLSVLGFPFEKLFYLFLMLLISTTIYEYFWGRKSS